MRRHLAGATTTLAGLGITVVIGCVLAGARAGGPYQRPAPPPPVGAFADGGVPARDAAIEAALAGLPGAVPAADHPALVGRPGVAAAWRGLSRALVRWSDLAWNDPARDRREAELRAHVATVSDQLAAAGLGYAVDLDVVLDGAVLRPVVHALRIDEVAFVRAGDERVRVLSVRRLDPVRVPMLGRSSEETDDPVVLIDQVEAKVAEQILPVLGGQRYPIGDPAWAHSPAGRAVAASTAAAIRRELAFALGPELRTDPTPRCRRLVSTSVRHHEAQHSLDAAHPLRHPAALARYLDDPPDAPLALRARHELSAYLSQIASDTWLPQLVLWNLARHAFRPHDTPLAEAVVAAVIIEQLARATGAPRSDPVITRGRIDRDRLAALVDPLTRLDTVVLRSAAAAAWSELFGTKLVRLVDVE